MEELEPAILTIFGLTGDLAKRKLLPALYRLAHDEMLPKGFKIVGLSRRGTTVDEVLKVIRASVNAEGKRCSTTTMKRLEETLSIVDMDITQPKEYIRLKQELDSIENSVGQCLHRLFYLAIPSTLFESVVERLGEADLNTGCQHSTAESRLMIEKPFGYDLESAEELIKTLHQSFKEKQIYRIDHYLAKETVQNILTFRFNNPLFSGAWNHRDISHIMITAAESIGIEGRTDFYETTGALRDLVQSHLVQILSLVTMDEPANMSSDSIHKSKVALMKQIVPPSPDAITTQTVRGQYATYNQEVGNAHSQTETYAAIRFTVDNKSWHNTPMYIRTGKALASKVTEVTVVFKNDSKPDSFNYLTIRIQPNEGIILRLHIKKPGYLKKIENVPMDFCYDEHFGINSPGDYERVLVDALRGDKTLFATSEEVLESWRIIEPVLQSWQTDRQPLLVYENDSWGPKVAEHLLNEVGDNWMYDETHQCAAPHGDKVDTASDAN